MQTRLNELAFEIVQEHFSQMVQALHPISPWREGAGDEVGRRFFFSYLYIACVQERMR